MPKLYFRIKKTEVELLMHCAKLHYDGACQRAAMSADLTPLQPGSHRDLRRQNGLLVIWKNWFEEGKDEAEVSATTDELDLVMKITEQWVSNQYQDKTEEVVRLHYLFRKMFDLSQRAYAMWKLEVEL